MLEERKFRIIVMSATLIVAILVGVSYFTFYKKMPKLNAQNVTTISKEQKDFPILPFDAFSALKSDLILKFGDGEQGNGFDYDNQYIDYNQTWFGKKFKARYYYGLYDRIYQINLPVAKNDIKSVYDDMKAQLGKPVYDTFYDKTKPLDESVAYWVEDSTRFSILYDEGQCFVKMKLEYYSNPDGNNLGQRPTVIQRIDGDTNVLSGTKANILLIGDKEEYTQKYYKNIYVVVGSKNGSVVGRLPKDTDGGMYPKMSIMDINGSGNKDILIEADNEYVKWYTGLEYEDGNLNVIYSSENYPQEGNPSNNMKTKEAEEIDTSGQSPIFDDNNKNEN